MRARRRAIPKRLATSRALPPDVSRASLVLSVVQTDNTFTCQPSGDWVGKCLFCGTKVAVSAAGSTIATIEHIFPLTGGGDLTDPHNLGLACRRCNGEKGARHDRHVGKGGRADEVIAAMLARRADRWRDAP